MNGKLRPVRSRRKAERERPGAGRWRAGSLAILPFVAVALAGGGHPALSQPYEEARRTATVVVTGSAPIRAGDRDRADRQAREAAIVTALGQVYGFFVSPADDGARFRRIKEMFQVNRSGGEGIYILAVTPRGPTRFLGGKAEAEFEVTIQITSIRVRAEGTAPLAGGTRPETEEAAYGDARRKAIEEAVGVFVSANTVVENQRVLLSEIVAASHGYVRDWHPLGDPDWSAGDMVRVVIEAFVSPAPLREVLREMQPPSTVLVTVMEEIDGEPSEDEGLYRRVESWVRQDLIDLDYKVKYLMPRHSDEVRHLLSRGIDQFLGEAVYGGGASLRERVSLAYLSNEIVVGEVKIVTREPRTGGREDLDPFRKRFVTAECAMHLVALDPSNDEIVCERDVARARELGLDKSQACARVLHWAYEKIKEKGFLNCMGERRSAESDAYRVLAGGLPGRRELEDLASVLRARRDVREVSIESYRKGAGALKLRWNRTVPDPRERSGMIDRLTASLRQSGKFEVLRQSGAELGVEYLSR